MQKFDALDLSLMHHYTCHTSVNLVHFPGAAQTWQTTVPLEARSFPLLQHGMLALAAAELASSEDLSRLERAKYCARAMQHQHMGLSMFRELIHNSEAKAKKALVAFSSVLVVLAFALAEPELSLDGILEVFALLRGINLLERIHGVDIRKLEEADTSVPTVMDPEPCIAPDEYHNEGGICVASTDVHCRQALDVVRRSCLHARTHPLEVRAISFLPILASDTFWTQVTARHSEALVVIAQYATIFECLAEHWWLRRWDKLIRAAIARESSSQSTINNE